MACDPAPRRPRSIGRALNFATAATNALCNALLAPHDLTLPQWVVLSALWQRDGLSVSELADYTGNAGPAASRIIDRMVEKGLVGRRPDPRDRRATVVFLEQRAEALRHLRGFHEQVNAILLAGFTEAEAAALYALLARAEANARRLGADPTAAAG